VSVGDRTGSIRVLQSSANETRTDVRSGFRLPLLETPDGFLARSHRLLQPTRHRLVGPLIEDGWGIDQPGEKRPRGRSWVLGHVASGGAARRTFTDRYRTEATEAEASAHLCIPISARRSLSEYPKRPFQTLRGERNGSHRCRGPPP